MSRHTPFVRLAPFSPRPMVAASRPRLRVLGFGPSGSGMQFFRPLLMPDIEFWTAVYPGRETRRHEPFAPSVEALARDLLPAARCLVTDGAPTVLLGHSLGVGVAVEVAIDMPGISLLALSAGRGPGRTVPQQDAEMRRVVSDDGQLKTWLAGLGGTPPAIIADNDFMAMQLPILRADLLASLLYRPSPPATPPLDVPMILFCGDQDPILEPDDMLTWRSLTSGPVTTCTLTGGHHALVEQPAATIEALSVSSLIT